MPVSKGSWEDTWITLDPEWLRTAAEISRDGPFIASKLIQGIKTKSNKSPVCSMRFAQLILTQIAEGELSLLVAPHVYTAFVHVPGYADKALVFDGLRAHGERELVSVSKDEPVATG